MEAKIVPPPVIGRILLVEDVAATRQLLKIVLERMGCAVDEAPDGATALELGQKSLDARQPYDLVFMDLQLPDLDGCDVTRRLRQQGWTRAIVALTASSDGPEWKRCLDAGCDDCVSKTIDQAGLLRILARFIPRQVPKRPQRGAEPPLFTLNIEDGGASLLDDPHIKAADRQRVIDGFLKNLASRLVPIEGALAARDRAALAQAVHKVTGTSGLLGFMAISRTAWRVEDLALHDAPWETVVEAAEHLLQLCRTAIVESQP